MIYRPKLIELIDELENSIMIPENEDDILNSYKEFYNRSLELIEIMKALENESN